MILKILTVVAVTSLVGCSNLTYKIKKKVDAIPVKSETQMSQALQCMGGELKSSSAKNPSYVFLVRDMVDGTVKKEGYTEGPLADSGKIQLASILGAYTEPSYAVVTDNFPMIFSALGNEVVGLNRYGLPSEQNMKGYKQKLLSYVNLSRKQKGLPLTNDVIPLVIDGAFTRLDAAPTDSKGYGHNGGYRGGDTEERSSAVDFGKSISERSITLVVNIIDPRFNTVVGTESFDLTFYNNSKTARFRVAINDFYYGFSNTDVVAESVHAAQQALLDAAAVWILDNAYKQHVAFEGCFNNSDIAGLGTDDRAKQNLENQGKEELASQTEESKQKPVENAVETTSVNDELPKAKQNLEDNNKEIAALPTEEVTVTTTEVAAVTSEPSHDLASGLSPSPQSAIKGFKIVNADEVRMRSSAVDGDLLKFLYKGDVVTFMETTQNRKWSLVSDSTEKEGWVASKYLRQADALSASF